MTAWIPFAVALLVVAGSTPLVRHAALRWRFIDHPNTDRFHSRSVPLGGGLALVLGIGVAYAVSWKAASGGAGSLLSAPALAGGMLIALLGLIDDRRGLHPMIKMAGQIAAAVLLVSGLHAPAWLAALAVVGVVGLINACNFLDNMDGILAGIATVCGLAFCWIGGGDGPLAALGAAVAGGAVGFLLHNAPPARIFMGDMGSMVLGYLLAALALGVLAGGSQAPGPVRLVGVLLVVGYPIFDITFVTLIRLAEGRSILLGGKDHSTHRLHRIIDDPRVTALVIHLLTAAIAVTGVIILGCSTASLAAALGGAVALVLVVLGIRLARVPVG
jgi:UDP-GlcNAc:undecaprenyl-phosphate GlcNAc-1-phosphate transferase